jgi:cytochrome c biogenesis protein CcdA
MKNKKIKILTIFLLSLTAFYPFVSYGKGSPDIVVYGSGCMSCFDKYINELSWLEETGLADVEPKHIRKNIDAEDELDQIREELGIPAYMEGVTTVVVNDKYVFEWQISVDELESFISLRMEDLDSVIVQKKIDYYLVMINGGKVEQCNQTRLIECLDTDIGEGEKTNTLALILVSGLLDGVNPCAFAVLIFFVGLLFSSEGEGGGGEKKILWMGGLYILTIFITYLAVGLTLYRIIELSNYAYWIAKLGGVAMILLAILNLAEFLTNKGFTLRIPLMGQMEIYKWITRLNYPATIVSGVLVAIFELPCTGAVYFGIISLLASSQTWLKGYTYLILYNLAFIIPLLLILMVTWARAKAVPSLGATKHRYLKLLSAILFLTLGIYILLT